MRASSQKILYGNTEIGPRSILFLITGTDFLVKFHYHKTKHFLENLQKRRRYEIFKELRSDMFVLFCENYKEL